MLCRCLVVAMLLLGIGTVGCSNRPKRELPKTNKNGNKAIPPEVAGSPEDGLPKRQQKKR
ncbi:MAG: hypothetical protein ACFCD0_25435 [Gemmataceae bacterium]